MMGTIITTPATADATREAAAFTDLAHQAMRRADYLIRGVCPPDRGARALAQICATTIQDDEALGLERGSDWVDDLLDMMALLGRNPSR